MDSRTYAILIAASLVVVDLITSILLTLISPARVGARVVRFILTCVVAFLFVRGHGWTRWLIGIGNLIGLPLGLIGFFMLPEKLSLLGLWMIVMLAYEAYLVYAMFWDQRIREHFGLNSGF